MRVPFYLDEKSHQKTIVVSHNIEGVKRTERNIGYDKNI